MSLKCAKNFYTTFEGGLQQRENCEGKKKTKTTKTINPKMHCDKFSDNIWQRQWTK